MKLEELKYLWQEIYQSCPDEDHLKLIHEVITMTQDYEKVGLWLLVESSALTFTVEEDRSLWIARRMKAYHDGKMAASRSPKSGLQEAAVGTN